MKCKKCNSEMKQSKAIINEAQYSNDIDESLDIAGKTASNTGDAVLVVCFKCQNCGHSFVPTKTKIIQSATKNTEWLKEAKWRQENKEWLDMSGRIALKVLRYLRKENITQKDLAEKLGWSPQQVSKLLKGSHNMTLKTICKLQTVTGLVLIEIK